ncbi:MAG: lysophospholipase [Fibrobacterales bacterium]
MIVIANIIIFNHAYRLTHFEADLVGSVKKAEHLSLSEKALTLFTGVTVPKPKILSEPKRVYHTVKILSSNNHELDGWYMAVPNSKGTVLMFHGYIGKKSNLIRQAEIFNDYGYNTLLIDFHGSGLSSGMTTTIGYYEADDVKYAFDYVKTIEDKEIHLFGPSMGAVAIMRAVAHLGVTPDKLILECPYGSLLSAIKNRVVLLGAPTFGFSELLVLWGGIQNNFWGFDLNAMEYAKLISVPTLLMHGDADKKATMKSVQSIYGNLKGEKVLKIFKGAKHERFVKRFEDEWKSEVGRFLL